MSGRLNEECGYSLWQTSISSDWRRMKMTHSMLIKHKYKLGRRGGNDSIVTQMMENFGGYPTLSFLEWLMGIPIGWSALEPLETVRFQQWLELHGKY
jgi:hypothetical protein